MKRSETKMSKVGRAPEYSLAAKFWYDVMEERGRQCGLLDSGKFTVDVADRRTPWGQKLAVLVEEVGEVGVEVCDAGEGRPDPGKLRRELTQVAAVCCAWAESLGGSDGRSGK